MPKSSDAKVRANDRYNKKMYESIGLRVHKGIRQSWKIYADAYGLSLAGLIVKAVSEYIQRHPPGSNSA